MDIAQLLLLRLLVTGHPHCLREDLLPSEGVVPLVLPCLGEVGEMKPGSGSPAAAGSKSLSLSRAALGSFLIQPNFCLLSSAQKRFLCLPRVMVMPLASTATLVADGSTCPYSLSGGV